jgi:HSP20 family protein
MLPSLWKERGGLYAPTVDDFVERFFYGWPTFAKNTDTAWIPRVDVNENDKDIVIDVELPGIDKKDVKVEVKDSTLLISGERKSERSENKEGCCVAERHYGKFERTFTLSDAVDAAKIAAKYKDGVLTLTLPKTEKALPREIAVDVK